jgi:3-deoxy-D-manno-octulosonic-acid transferase
MSLGLSLWRGFGHLAAPVVRALLRRRIARGKEDPARLAERLGQAGLRRPDGPLVWLHGASVGEALSILPLVDRLLAARADLHVLVTTGTVTSAKLMAERLPPRALHQYVPVDVPEAVDPFVAHWRPDLALWVESELWPGLIAAARRTGTPFLLINGRMSERSHRRWRWAPFLIRPLLTHFDTVLAQTPADALRFRTLGAPKVEVGGNLKYAAPPLACDAEDLARLRAALGDRPVWLAASTHPGEEDSIVAAHGALVARFPDLLTIVVPRHPERGRDLAARFGAPRRGAGHAVPAGGLYIADTLGELGLWYRLAPIALVGGSLVPKGGQNLLEPARLDCAILHGPHMDNFPEVAAALAAAGGARTVVADTLADGVADLFGDAPRRHAMVAAARVVAARDDGVLERVLAAALAALRRP